MKRPVKKRALLPAEAMLVPSKRTDLEHRVAVIEAKLAQLPTAPTLSERLARVEAKLGLATPPTIIQMCQRCHHVPAVEIVEGTRVCVRCAPLYRAERQRGRGP